MCGRCLVLVVVWSCYTGPTPRALAVELGNQALRSWMRIPFALSTSVIQDTGILFVLSGSVTGLPRVCVWILPGSHAPWTIPSPDPTLPGSHPSWIPPFLDPTLPGSHPPWTVPSLDLTLPGPFPPWISPSLDHTLPGSHPSWIPPSLDLTLPLSHPPWIYPAAPPPDRRCILRLQLSLNRVPITTGDTAGILITAPRRRSRDAPGASCTARCVPSLCTRQAVFTLVTRSRLFDAGVKI